ncbi:MAG: transglycosylase SLT domain-containing protein, partial [Terriglobales bacterium]
MRLAFVASSSLKSMARQLLQDRTPTAYAGVEAYARRHGGEDAGALAWLVVGYAHTLDHDYAQAIPALSRAHPRAGELGDYVDYYRGESYFQTGRIPEAMAALSGFEKKYPESLLIVDAHLLYANLLVTEGQAHAAAALLEQNRKPVRADVELALGRAYAAAGDTTKATAIFSNLYFTMPLSFEATEAGQELQKLSPATLSSAAVGDLRMRADLLARGRRYSDAADEYRALLNQVAAGERPALQLSLVDALRHAGRAKEAKQALETVPSAPPEINAGRLFNLGELARAENDDDTFLKILDQLRQVDATSPYLEDALLEAGNIYLLRPDYDRAIDSYRELQVRFPNAAKASYAHWKVAWLSLRQGRNAEAKTEFENQIGLYPNSAEVPAALYWRARLAQEDGDQAMAAAYYQKLSLRFRNYYYGELAREQLHKMKVNGPPQHYALLDRVPPMSSDPAPTDDTVPTDDLRVQKAHLLENGALLDFAVRELKAADEEDKGAWLPAETARMYEDAGRYDVAIEVLKRAVPNYFAVDLDTLPRSYWEALFPKPYWLDLKRFSSSNALDPYLVASLIRQESEFNPNALSRKDAVGLMQLLPKVGKTLAKQEKIKHYRAAQLFTPGMNLQLGTRYFRAMVDKFGAFEYALAAYNAGTDRVQSWLGDGKYRDPQEFVESIPFTETREYVQAILR